MVHNKTLAAQLYAEFRDFFPKKMPVEYFVCLITIIINQKLMFRIKIYLFEKIQAINEHIEQMRLSATKIFLEREDVIIVATVSAIYGKAR